MSPLLLLPITVLLLTASPANTAKPTTVTIGALFPFYPHPSRPSEHGMRNFDAFRMAVKSINADRSVLPTTQLHYAVRDSRSAPNVAFTATQDLVANSKVDVILVGQEDVFAAHDAAPDVALVGHTSTSPTLSDKTIYPNFVRTGISDHLIARNIAAFVRSEAIGASHVSIISSSDQYSSDLAHSFVEHASGQSIRIITAIQFAAGSTNLLAPVTDLFQNLHTNHKSNEGVQYLVLLFASALDTINVMRAAHASGNTGASVTWLLTESILGKSTLLQREMGEDLDSIMVGSFVVHANNGRGNAQYTSLWNEWKQRPSTAGTATTGTGALDSTPTTYGVHGTGPSCNTATDNTNNTIYMFDDDDNPTTPSSCGGVNFVADAKVTKTLTFGIPFVYDAVHLVAHALHEMIEVEHANTFTAPKLTNAMKRVSFPGVSGTVNINMNGDRNVDDYFACIVSNFKSNTQDMEPVGVVKSKQNSNSTRDQSEFLLYKDTSIIYSTPDGTQPTFYPSQTESSVGSILVIILACAIPFFTVLMASLALCRTPGTKLARRKLQMNRLERVLLQNESFYIVARDVSVGRTFNCHRSTWVAETHLVDVALLVLKDNRNIEKTADSVKSLVDEVHFMKQLQTHPNILHCYGLLLMGSSDDSTELSHASEMIVDAEGSGKKTNERNKNVFESGAKLKHIATRTGATTMAIQPQAENNDLAVENVVLDLLPSALPSSNTLLSRNVLLDTSPFPNFVLATTGALASVALVLEWCEHGSLNRLLREERHRLTLEQCLQMASELAQGVWYLHNQDPPLAHPALNSSNVYVTIDFCVKLGGCFPRNIEKSSQSNDTQGHELAANTYSLGIILSELFLQPSFHDSQHDRNDFIVPSCLNNLVVSMKNHDPNLRPGIDNVVHQIDIALRNLQSQKFAAVDNMSPSLFTTLWSKDVHMNDPLHPQPPLQVKTTPPTSPSPPSSAIGFLREKKLVAPGDLHVLLVDDDDFALASMQHALEMCHYAVTGCNSGIKAMNFLLAKPNKYDVVLSDAFMPAMNGLSLLGAVQGDPQLRHIPVVLVSSSTAQIARALKLGARDYLVKPLRVFEAMTLFPKVKMWRIQMDNSSTPPQPRPDTTKNDFTTHMVATNPIPSAGSEMGQNGNGNTKNNGRGSSRPSSKFQSKNAQTVVSQMTEQLLSSSVVSSGLNLDAIKIFLSGSFKKMNSEDLGIQLIMWPKLQLKRVAGMGSGGCVFEASLNLCLEEEEEQTSVVGFHVKERSVACKRFNRESLKTHGGAIKGYLRELEMLSMLHHPNIMELIGITEHEEFVWHVCEFVQFGSLGEVLQEPNIATFLTVAKRIDILLGVADALKYMHNQRPTIIHRDLKPSNILISHDLTAKLSDFAYSRAIAGPRKMTRCGTPAYVAPEVMLGYPYDESIDTYAFGVVFWQVITRAKPFATENDPVIILQKTSSGERCEFPSFEVCCSVLGNLDLSAARYLQFIELTRLCWHQDRTRRPSMSGVVQELDNSQQQCL